MTIVVGAEGFVGSRLARAFTREGGPVERVSSAELRDDSAVERLAARTSGRTVYYCAAVDGAAGRERDRIADRLTATVPARLAAAAGKFVHVSTDEVFSAPGEVTEASPPTPADATARSVVAGERAVLAASPSALVVRVSRPYDEEGIGADGDHRAGTVAAPDDRTSAPTYAPDLVTTLRRWVADDGRGVRHAVGPDALSEYELQQLASLRWGHDVTPTLSGAPRATIVRPSAGATIRRPADVFTAGRKKPRSGAPRGERVSSGPVLVLDCVGVVLSARPWRERDPAVWQELELGPERAVREWGPDRVAGAYGPNPPIWRALRAQASGREIVLANNGPWLSFSRWFERYGFGNLFDEVINSERDGLTKPSDRFRQHVEAYAGGRPIVLLDDRLDIVDRATEWGWCAHQTRRLTSWPFEEYDTDDPGAVWRSAA